MKLILIIEFILFSVFSIAFVIYWVKHERLKVRHFNTIDYMNRCIHAHEETYNYYKRKQERGALKPLEQQAMAVAFRASTDLRVVLGILEEQKQK